MLNKYVLRGRLGGWADEWMDERRMAGWVVDGGGRDEWMGRMGGWARERREGSRDSQTEGRWIGTWMDG